MTQFCANISNDRFWRNYTPVLQAFATIVGATVPATLLAQVLNSNSIPQAYVAFTGTVANAKIQLLHCPAFYAPVFGVPSLWDINIYIQKGDISHNMKYIVEWSQNSITQMADMNCASVQMMLYHFAQNLAAQMVGPYAIGDVGAEIGGTRKLAYCPAKYANLQAASGGMSVCRALERLIPVMIRDNMLIQCSVCVDWLRVTLTTHANNLKAANLCAPLLRVVGDDDLSQHCNAIFLRDCLGYNRQMGMENQMANLAVILAESNR